MRQRVSFVIGMSSLAALCWSCGGRAVVRFTPSIPEELRPREAPCTVQVFRDATPERPYVELGTIDYHHERHRTSAGRLRFDVALLELERRACTVGADALVNIRITEQKKLEWALFHVSATAVRFEPQ